MCKAHFEEPLGPWSTFFNVLPGHSCSGLAWLGFDLTEMTSLCDSQSRGWPQQTVRPRGGR